MKSLKKSSFLNHIKKMDMDPNAFSTLPEDIVSYEIGSFLNLHDKARLREVSRFFNRQFNGEGLLQTVVYGNLATVRTILAHDQNGDLLLKAYTVTDYSGRRIHQTAYQAALAALDEEMAAIIQEQLLKHHGRDEVKSQQAKLFPEHEEKEWELRQQNDLNALNTIIEAIEQATVSEEKVDGRSTLIMDKRCEQAMMNFRKYLESSKNKLITTGRHWNPALLQRAFELYAEKYHLFGADTKSPKNLLSLRQVIGTIMRDVPANFGHAFAQGLNTMVMHNEKLIRLFEFKYGGGSYFPLDSDSKFQMGYDLPPTNGATQLWPGPEAAACSVYFFRIFCGRKTKKIQELCNAPASTQVRPA